jgi:Glycosyl transferase family 2
MAVTDIDGCADGQNEGTEGTEGNHVRPFPNGGEHGEQGANPKEGQEPSLDGRVIDDLSGGCREAEAGQHSQPAHHEQNGARLGRFRVRRRSVIDRADLGYGIGRKRQWDVHGEGNPTVRVSSFLGARPHISGALRYPYGMDPVAPSEPPFKLLTIFYPMWNEEEYLHRALGAGREACNILLAQGEIGDYELLIVNDASTDATGRMADELAATDRRVRVVHHPVNRKLGGSLKTGFAESRGDLILYSDADLPFDMDELQKACRVMRHYEADIVSTYRFDRTGEGYVRVVYSFFYNTLVKVLFGVKMRDVNFAFKLVRKRVFDHVKLESEGSFIDAELVIRAQRYGYRVVQFGVDYFPRTRGVSTLSSPSVIVKLLREMFQLRRQLRDIQPVKA